MNQFSSVFEAYQKGFLNEISETQLTQALKTGSENNKNMDNIQYIYDIGQQYKKLDLTPLYLTDVGMSSLGVVIKETFNKEKLH